MPSTITQSHYDQILHAARHGPTLFGRDQSGAVGWRVSGIDRCVLYQLLAEVGVQGSELAALTSDDFWLDGDLPMLLLGPFSQSGRRGLHLPLEGAMKSALAEYLSERPQGEPVFFIGDGACVEHVLRFDASQAGLLARHVGVSALESFFAATVGNAETTGKVWSDHAVELRASAKAVRP